MCGWDEGGSLEDDDARFAFCVWRRQLSIFLSLLMAALLQETPQRAALSTPSSLIHAEISRSTCELFPGDFLAVPPLATLGIQRGWCGLDKGAALLQGLVTPLHTSPQLTRARLDLNWGWHAPVERDSPGIRALLLQFELAADVKHDMVLENFLCLPWNEPATGIKRALCWGYNHITNWTLPHVRAGTSTRAYLTCICPKVQMLRSWHSIIWI